jgi:hypothetical protein
MLASLTARPGHGSREPAHTRAYAVAVSVAVPDALAVTSSADIGVAGVRSAQPISDGNDFTHFTSFMTHGESG